MGNRDNSVTKRGARHEKRDEQVATDRQTDRRTDVAPTARGAATDFGAQDAAMVWWYCSPLPKERAIAGKRFDALLGRGLDPDELLLALAEYAVLPDETGAPHHAIGFTEKVARAFAATIRERRHEQSKSEERYAEPTPHTSSLRRLDVDALLRKLA